MACQQKPTLETLEELGFTAAKKTVETSQALVRKTAIAYEHFDYVTPEDVQAFNDSLYSQRKVDKKTGRQNYYTLRFHKTQDYAEVPPTEVLDKMRAAKAMSCFDYFEIAKIEFVSMVPDPILFGRIEGVGDRFFVAQWDNDVTIEAIKAASQK